MINKLLALLLVFCGLPSFILSGTKPNHNSEDELMNLKAENLTTLQYLNYIVKYEDSLQVRNP